MVLGRHNLGGWAVVALLSAGGGLGMAQPVPSPAGSLFSKPAAGGLPAASSAVQSLPDSLSGKHFRDYSADSPSAMPSPTPDVNPALQKQMSDRAKWTLMTPEEIMGLQTPEEIFGLPDKDKDPNASPEERYLRRQEKARLATKPEEFSGSGHLNHGFSNLFEKADKNGPSGISAEQSDSDQDGFSQIFKHGDASPFSHDNNIFDEANANFVSATEKAKAEKEQAADMAKFRSLIGESPDPASAALPAAHLETAPSPSSFSAFDDFGHPASVSSVDLSKPGGLAVPSAVFGYVPPPREPKKPSWEPQAPPWLSSGVNPPTTPPVRKFY